MEILNLIQTLRSNYLINSLYSEGYNGDFMLLLTTMIIFSVIVVYFVPMVYKVIKYIVVAGYHISSEVKKDAKEVYFSK